MVYNKIFDDYFNNPKSVAIDMPLTYRVLVYREKGKVNKTMYN